MDIINTILDEIEFIHNALKNSNCHLAKAMYLDFCGDVKKLSERDRGAACSLLWYGKASNEFNSDIHGYIWNDISRCFQLAW